MSFVSSFPSGRAWFSLHCSQPASELSELGAVSPHADRSAPSSTRTPSLGPGKIEGVKALAHPLTSCVILSKLLNSLCLSLLLCKIRTGLF